MNKAIGVLILVLGILAAVVGPWVYGYFRVMGYHKGDVMNVHPGSCTNIPGIENGSEDFEMLPNGKLLITSGLGGIEWPPGPVNRDTQGKILLLDLNQPEPEPVEVSIKGDLDLDSFRPLGITKWVNRKIGKITILVVNVIGAPQATVVERFVYSEVENVLYHVETIGLGDPNFFIVDDIAAVSERSFYYTNIHGKHATWEAKFLLPWGSIGFFDGKESHLVDEGLPGPNGIFFSQDKRYLYVVMCIGMYVRTYERMTDNSLTQIQDFPMKYLGDNIYVDDDGDAWVAGHITGWQVFAYMADRENNHSPTQVIRLKIQKGRVTSSANIFIDDGKLMSGGSIAVPYKNKLVIGSVMTTATICNMDSESEPTEE